MKITFLESTFINFSVFKLSVADYIEISQLKFEATQLKITSNVVKQIK